jgi:hypothetical protein
MRVLGGAPYSPFLAGSIQSDLRALRSMARLNSANAPTICIIMRPAGVVVSIAFCQAAKSGFGLSQPFHYRHGIAKRTD